MHQLEKLMIIKLFIFKILINLVFTKIVILICIKNYLIIEAVTQRYLVFLQTMVLTFCMNERELI